MNGPSPPVVTGNPPFEDLPPEIQQQIAEQCTSEACQRARFRLQEIRDEFELKCAEVQSAYRNWQDLGRIATIFIALFIALLAIVIVLYFLSWIPGVGAALTAALILLAFVFALMVMFQILTSVAQKRFLDRQRELDEIRDRFRQQRSEVVAACNSYCWDDLDEPMCPLNG